uniref:ARAD1D22022p n=1 Tax=Blastobotrys adeninivorans TaxID=409370 RepID=A0A060TAR5_BLAAD
MHTQGESASLLGNNVDQRYNAVEGPPSVDDKYDAVETTTKNEIKFLIKNSTPVAVTFSLQYFLAASALFVVGRIGKDELAAISLATTLSEICGYAIVVGITTCLDTLATQSYGRQDYEMVGLHCQRCLVFLAIVTLPVMGVWIFSEPILHLMIPQYEVARMSAQCLRILAMGMPAYYIFEVLKHFLQAQDIFHATTYVLLIGAPLNMFLYYLLVWNERFGMGLVGAPMAIVITDWVLTGLAVAYIAFVDGSKCWVRPRSMSDLFSHWGPMVKLAVPGIIMVEAEWLAFQVLTIISAQFGTDALAGQAVLGTLCTMAYQIPQSLGITASTRVGNLIGAQAVRAAKISTNAAFRLCIATGSANAFIMFFFRNSLGRIFSNDEGVIAVVSSVLPLAALFQLNDSLGAVSGGILRGQGRQWIGGVVNVFFFYIMMLPLALLFAFTLGYGVNGLWMGLVVGVLFVSGFQYYFVSVSDWKSLVDAHTGME